MSRHRHTKNKSRDELGVAVGGPVAGTHFPIKSNQKNYFFPTPTDPFYCGAFYTLVNQVTPLRERIAVFNSHLRRG